MSPEGKYIKEETIIAQRELTGNPRKHKVDLQGLTTLYGTRITRVVQALNETTGQLEYYPVDKAPVDPSVLPHTQLSKAKRHCDPAYIGTPTLETTLKQGTSLPGSDIKAKWRSQGGDPDYRPSKTGGFAFRSTVSELQKKEQDKNTPIRKQ